ncbi:MAG: ABC transporter ATP-binding protein/permease [Treponema sp.]|nr:ABC transporter ATP-binding protein/permease [Treponema sp.]
MSKVLQYMKPYLGILFIAIALLTIQAMCDLALPDYMSNIVNNGIMSGSTIYIWQTGGKMLLVTLLGTAASITMGYCAAYIASSVAHNIRFDVFKKVQSFSNAEIDKYGTASLITRTTNDITQVQIMLVISIRMIFYAPILGTGGVLHALSKSASMSWVIAASVIALIAFILIIYFTAVPKFKIIQNLVDRLNLVAKENLQGMLVIRAFNTQTFEEKRFDVANTNLMETQLFVNRAMALAMPFIMLVMNLTTVLIIWIGSNQVSALKVEIGDMMAFMQYAMQILMSFLMLSIMFILIPRAAVSAERIKDVLETENSITDPEKPQKYRKDFTPVVEFKNVSFRYPGGDSEMLYNISFTARKGETTAIIGATGSGKSTLVNLLIRFYDIDSGEILIDGVDIRNVTLKDLRDKISYIPQKSLLFSGTIESNLKYALDQRSTENAGNEAMERAARISQSTEFIDEKPEKYDSIIAQGGANVSGGQKQRLSIARAIVKNAPIYIFDDSFSALDLKTDAALRVAIKKEIKDVTLFIVAQRISTIKDAEQIIVLDHGTIAGIGTHKELLESCTIYREIATSQLSEEELLK